MKKLKGLTKAHWQFFQFLEKDCVPLYTFLKKHAPLWEDIYHHAYTSNSVTDFDTEDGLKVSMAPYKMWETMFQPKKDFEKSVYMLCCMGLIGIDENDFCTRKEWVFYSLPQDFKLIEWYCKLLNAGIANCKGQQKSFQWIKENLKDGCTYHKMVCRDGRSDYITVGNPGQLARTLF
tara:strand:- start:2506 stop:3036 length:531 start_codon:yes stop_codon:yes gene_type:complete